MDASEDFDPFYNPVHRDTDELLHENFISMAEKNKKEMNAADKIQGLFRHGKSAEFIFEICEELDLCNKVKFQAVELFSRFLPRHMAELRILLSNANSSASEKEADWQKIMKQVESQLTLRVASCAQVVAKSSSYADKVTPCRIQRVLHTLGKDYTVDSISKSELRVLSTLNYSVNVSSPFEFVLTLLELLGRRNAHPQLPLLQYQMVSSDLLLLVYLKSDEIYHHLLLSLSIDPPEKTLERMKADKLLAALGVIATAAFIYDPNHALLVREELACVSGFAGEDIDAFKKALLQVVHSSSHQGTADSSRGSLTPGLGYQYQQGPSSSVSVNQPHQRPAPLRSFQINDILSSPVAVDQPHQHVSGFMRNDVLLSPVAVDQPHRHVSGFMMNDILSSPVAVDQPHRHVSGFMRNDIQSSPVAVDQPHRHVSGFMMNDILSSPVAVDQPHRHVSGFMMNDILSSPVAVDQPHQHVSGFMRNEIQSSPVAVDQPHQHVSGFMMNDILSSPVAVDQPHQHVSGFMMNDIQSSPVAVDQPHRHVSGFVMNDIQSSPVAVDQPHRHVSGFMMNDILSSPVAVDQPHRHVSGFVMNDIQSSPVAVDQPHRHVSGFMMNDILS